MFPNFQIKDPTAGLKFAPSDNKQPDLYKNYNNGNIKHSLNTLSNIKHPICLSQRFLQELTFFID